MKRIRWILPVLGVAMLAQQSQADDAKPEMSFQDLKIYLMECSERARLRIVAPRGDQLTEQSLSSRTLSSGSSLMVGCAMWTGAVCPQARQIVLTGETGNGDLWFAGKLQGDQLTGLYAPPP